MLLELSVDRGPRIGREGAPVGVEAANCLHHGDVCDLRQVIDVRPMTTETNRAAPGDGLVGANDALFEASSLARVGMLSRQQH